MFLFKIIGNILTKVGTILLIAYIAYLCWQHLGPQKPKIRSDRKGVADKLIPQIAEDIRTSKEKIRGASVAHFDGDTTGYFTKALRSELDDKGVLDVTDRGLMEKVRDLLGMRATSYDEIEAAARYAADLDKEAVIFGKIHTFEVKPGGVELDVELTFAEAGTKRVLHQRRYTHDTSALPAMATGTTLPALAPPVDGQTGTAAATPQAAGDEATFHWGRRIFAWILLVVLLPVFSMSFIRSMARKDSNRANALVLGVYTVADILLAMLLVGPALAGWVAIGLFVVAIVVSILYNVQIMTVAVRLEE